MARVDCPICGGSGWKVVQGDAIVSPSEVRVSANVAKQANAAGDKALVVEGWNPSHGVGLGLPRVAVRCGCGDGDRVTRLLDRARVPDRYRHCDFDNFETDNDYAGSSPEIAGWHRSLQQAKLQVQ